jgi:hypothetical protein
MVELYVLTRTGPPWCNMQAKCEFQHRSSFQTVPILKASFQNEGSPQDHPPGTGGRWFPGLSGSSVPTHRTDDGAITVPAFGQYPVCHCDSLK